MKKWILGALGTVVISLTIAWITGGWNPVQSLKSLFAGGSETAEQYRLANDLARKYYFFSNGNDSWNSPNSMGFPNQFVPQGDFVYDKGTGLTWQRGGSDESLMYAKIEAYLRELNEQKAGGFDDWRLPTLAEAWSLLEHDKNKDGLYIDPLFAPAQTWIWTSTTTGDGYGWFIFFEAGQPVFQNAWNSHAYIRAVRGEVFE